mgnify:CR=1 FL=1
MVNVVVGRKRTIKVSSNATAGIIDSTTPVTIKNTPTLGTLGTTGRLDHLQDVVATGETNGATLVYEAATDKYIVKKLDLGDVTGDLDGGIF